jgi:hypothetical protein
VSLSRASIACLSILLSVYALALACGRDTSDTALDWDALFKGEVKVSSVENADTVLGVRAVFAISADPDTIWNAITDYAHFTQIFDGVKKITVLEKKHDDAKVEYWVNALFKEYHYVLDRDLKRDQCLLTWNRISGDLSRVEGSWTMYSTPQEGTNLLVYESFVKVGGVVPGGLVQWGVKRKAHSMAIRLRKWVEEKAVKRKG